VNENLEALSPAVSAEVIGLSAFARSVGELINLDDDLLASRTQRLRDRGDP
jgi:hypothetical protein